MGKDKKKHSKKDKASEDILDLAALSVKKFRKVTKEIGKLSTGQKLVGGLALVAAGLSYLAISQNGAAEKPNPAEPAPANDTAAEQEQAENHIKKDAVSSTAPSKSRKSSKGRFSTEHS